MRCLPLSALVIVISLVVCIPAHSQDIPGHYQYYGPYAPSGSEPYLLKKLEESRLENEKLRKINALLEEKVRLLEKKLSTLSQASPENKDAEPSK
jgi:hypothetical protein